MDDPKKKILEMVASGKVSVEEASALLDKLDDVMAGPKQPEAPEDAGRQPGRSLTASWNNTPAQLPYRSSDPCRQN